MSWFYLVFTFHSYLGEETFQREIMISSINASKGEHLLWNVERMVGCSASLVHTFSLSSGLSHLPPLPQAHLDGPNQHQQLTFTDVQSKRRTSPLSPVIHKVQTLSLVLIVRGQGQKQHL